VFSVVELILASLNTPPQVDGLLGRLSGPLPYRAETSGPSWRSDSAAGYTVENVAGRVPRPLNRRLSHNQRVALVVSFASGVKQHDLADKYGISVRSVKRLIHLSREQNVITLRQPSDTSLQRLPVTDAVPQ
jgi:hypothetical protein